MAWKLRQFFEGDKVITVNDVEDSGKCWVSGGNYVPNSIAIKVNGTQRLLPSITSLSFGFLVIPIPADVYIGPTTTIQVYAVCEDLPASKTLTLTAKPVNFNVTNTVLKACNPQVILNSDFDEYVRFYVPPTAGQFFNAKINSVNLDMAGFSYQSGDSGNIVSVNGDFSRPALDTAPASIVSNTPVTGQPILRVVPLTTHYFTARLGYIEVVFTGTNITYSNYLTNTEFEVPVGPYSVGDVVEIEAKNDSYIIRHKGVVITTKLKTITYAVSTGTISPATSTVGTPVAWTIPLSAGTYTFTVDVGTSLKFQKTVTVHSCADAVDDVFTGTYNQPYVGTVTLNDTPCTGENTYYQTRDIVGGTLVFNNATGAFTFTPTANYNGAASFTYDIKCGASTGVAEVVDTAKVTINYFDICNGVVANWQISGPTRCTECVEYREERDLNASCTGNQPRWVVNPGGSACDRQPRLVPTNETRCQGCQNQREVQDLNACSPSYLAKSWEANPTGSDCNRLAIWSNNGQFDCVDCAEKKGQVDTNACSPTYNTTRWADNPGGTKCNRLPSYTPLNEFICEDCIEYERVRDTNACSPTFNQVSKRPSFGGGICNTEAVWVDSGETKCENGIHYKEQKSSNACSTDRVRWVETGLDNCGCLVYVRYANKCEEETIVGVTVRIKGVSESNRLISHNNGTVVFQASTGTHTYETVLLRSSGMPVKIITANHTCTPLT